MSSSGSTFKAGAAGKGAGFTKDAHENHLLAFVTPHSEMLSTTYGDSEAALCPYVACLTCPEVFADVAIFGTVLVPRLVDGDNEELVVGRLVRGEAKPGRQAPWLLEDPLDEELVQTEEFFTAYATRLPSGKVVVDVDAVKPAAEPPY